MKNINKLDIAYLSKHLQARPKDCHKGNFGHFLVVGGNLGYAGAVRLAGEAALRVGAGCVSIATRPEHASNLTMACPELMCHGVSKASDLEKLLEKATFIAIGPGLGTNEWSLLLLKTLCAQKDKPVLFDADALNLLALKQINPQHAHSIFTPHPGEAARLLNTTTASIQQDRLKAIRQLYDLLGGTIVLKGAGTLILSKDSVEICCAGNPGMATAGMGDVLSGIIAGLAAQNIPLADAAKLGVYLHAMAGDLSATEKGERGMIASDLIAYLRGIVNLGKGTIICDEQYP